MLTPNDSLHHPWLRTSLRAGATDATGRRLTQRDALDWAIRKLDLRPGSDGYRVILTTTGLVALWVTDRFAEIVIDRHWAAIARALADGDDGDLSEFRGFDLGGHQLAYALEQIPRPGAGGQEVA